MAIGSISSFKNNPISRQGETVTITTYTNTTDSYGGVTAQTSTDTTATVVIGNITKQDEQIREMGLAEIGNMKMYYPIDVTVNTGDIITRGTIKYRVETITATYMDVYGIAVIKSLSLN